MNSIRMIDVLIIVCNVFVYLGIMKAHTGSYYVQQYEIMCKSILLNGFTE